MPPRYSKPDARPQAEPSDKSRHTSRQAPRSKSENNSGRPSFETSSERPAQRSGEQSGHVGRKPPSSSPKNASEGVSSFRGKKNPRPEEFTKSADKNAKAVDQNAPAEGVRLNKAIAASGLCSRRRADELILAGRVTVNGAPEPNPARHVLPFDSIEVDGRVLAAPQAFTYLLLNKPVQVVCTVNDPEGRPTVLDCLAPKDRTLRLYPVGRLDYFSEGLLLLTNDGQLAQRLMHPRHHQPKTYEVLVRGSVPETALKTMRRGMSLAEGEDVLPVDVTTESAGSDTVLRMVLRQGLNRQIRRMCRDLGLTILRLRRVAQGLLGLGDLAVGKARPLTAGEVARLRESAELPPKG